MIINYFGDRVCFRSETISIFLSTYDHRTPMLLSCLTINILLQVLLLLLALVAVPWMLFPKPFILKRLHTEVLCFCFTDQFFGLTIINRKPSLCAGVNCISNLIGKCYLHTKFYTQVYICGLTALEIHWLLVNWWIPLRVNQMRP